VSTSDACKKSGPVESLACEVADVAFKRTWENPDSSVIACCSLRSSVIEMTKKRITKQRPKATTKRHFETPGRFEPPARNTRLPSIAALVVASSSQARLNANSICPISSYQHASSSLMNTGDCVPCITTPENMARPPKFPIIKFLQMVRSRPDSESVLEQASTKHSQAVQAKRHGVPESFAVSWASAVFLA